MPPSLSSPPGASSTGKLPTRIMIRITRLLMQFPRFRMQVQRFLRLDGVKAAFMLAPAVAFVLVFVYLPAGISLVLGFFHYHLLGVDTTFGGLTDYRDALSYSLFWTAVGNTVYFAILMVPTTVVGAVLIALLIQRQTRWFSVIRSAVLLPYITPIIATTIGWMWMFNPQYGVFNAILEFFHLPPSQWLIGTGSAIPSIVLYSLWHGLGFDVVIILAALANVPTQVAEAASVEGAGGWQKFWKVTLPMISPTLFFVFIITSISALQVFSQVYSFSGGQGGPAYATMTLQLLIYLTAFSYFHFSYAAAMTILLVILILGLTLLQNWWSKRWVFYQ